VALHPARAALWVHVVEHLLLTLHAEEALAIIEEATRRLKTPSLELSALRQQAETALAWSHAGLPVPESAR
jgi:hypothetical protein